MVLRLRQRFFPFAACVIAVGSPSAFAQPPKAADENVSAPGFPARVVAPPSASKLDLSPWLIEDGTKMASLQENSSEYAACIHVLVAAHRLQWGTIARSTRSDVTFAHLSDEPAKYRGELVRVMGKIRRIRRFDPPALAAKEGVLDLYEGWLFDDKQYGAHPTCLLFSALPQGMEVGESVNYPAAFDGYFFKKYRYEGADGQSRQAPLLIGHFPVLANHGVATSEDRLAHGTSLVIGFLGLLAGTLFLALGLAWWYRNRDRQIRARVAAARARSMDDPFAEDFDS
jgi:hypothetical protein